MVLCVSRVQDETIRNIEARVEDCERQLTRLSASVRSLQDDENRQRTKVVGGLYFKKQE